jgi:hypothetical protein
MEFSFVQLMDLPDEILLIILKKLDNVDVLYSFIDVNTLLSEIVQDPIFNTKITLIQQPDILLIDSLRKYYQKSIIKSNDPKPNQCL